MKTIVCCLCVVALVGGCALPKPVEPLRLFESPGDALEISNEAVEAGRWSEALKTLDSAIERFPGEARLIERRRRLGDEWSHLEPLWEDQLATTQARAMFEEVEVMEPLVTAQPERVMLALQLSQRKKRLRSLRAALLECAERRHESDLPFAKSCAELGDRIASDEKSQALVALIAEKIDAQEKIERKRKAKVARSQLSSQINKAEKKLAARDYSGAAAAVSRVLAANPNNARAKAIQKKLEKTTSEQNTNLNDMANKAYTSGEIDAAIQLWEASLRIVPEQPEVKERLERAVRVLKNLEDLKAENPALIIPSVTEEPEPAVDVSTDL